MHAIFNVYLSIANLNTAKQKILYQNSKNISFSLSIVDETLVLLHWSLGSLRFTCKDSWGGCYKKSASVSNTKELGPQIHLNSPLSLGRETGNGPLVPLLHELSSSFKHNRTWPTCSLQLTIKQSLQNDKN